MSAQTGRSQREIAHVLFMDLVGYSLLSMDRQSQVQSTLQQIVRNTMEYRHAAAGQDTLFLPTGDGMAVVFFRDPAAPVRCALEVARGSEAHSDIKLRMGIHSGPVDLVEDINGNKNVSGSGINLAQRVMDCGDAGHILVSHTAADLLSQLGSHEWELLDLGTCKVKHGVEIHLFNLYTVEMGNREPPAKVASASPKQPAHRARPSQVEPQNLPAPISAEVAPVRYMPQSRWSDVVEEHHGLLGPVLAYILLWGLSYFYTPWVMERIAQILKGSGISSSPWHHAPNTAAIFILIFLLGSWIWVIFAVTRISMDQRQSGLLAISAAAVWLLLVFLVPAPWLSSHRFWIGPYLALLTLIFIFFCSYLGRLISGAIPQWRWAAFAALVIGMMGYGLTQLRAAPWLKVSSFILGTHPELQKMIASPIPGVRLVETLLGLEAYLFAGIALALAHRVSSDPDRMARLMWLLLAASALGVVLEHWIIPAIIPLAAAMLLSPGRSWFPDHPRQIQLNTANALNPLRHEARSKEREA